MPAGACRPPMASTSGCRLHLHPAMHRGAANTAPWHCSRPCAPGAAARSQAGQLGRRCSAICICCCEARAADEALLRLLPGWRRRCMPCASTRCAPRPALERFPAARRPLERCCAACCKTASRLLPALPEPAASVAQARRLAAHLLPDPSRMTWDAMPAAVGLLDRRPAPAPRRLTRCSTARRDARTRRHPAAPTCPGAHGCARATTTRTTAQPGAWMVQPAPPHEQAEDPRGLQRPTDRDTATPAEEFADALSELRRGAAGRHARPPPGSAAVGRSAADTRPARAPGTDSRARLRYPEWD